MAPVAMIAPWPCMRRGADAVVPIVPGFVSVMDVPANASSSIVPFRAFATMPSKASRNSPKDSFSAPLTFGTRRLRVPSFFVMSIAMPRFTAALRMRAGLPPASPYASFIPGCFSSARTIAHATKCVKDTFERPSASRCRFRMRRFSSIVLTGTTRFVTAVGTPSEASMFLTIVAAPPEIGIACSPARGPGAGGRAGTTGEAAPARRGGRRRRKLGNRLERSEGPARHRVRDAFLDLLERLFPGLAHRRRLEPVLRVELERERGVVAEFLEHGGRGREDAESLMAAPF